MSDRLGVLRTERGWGGHFIRAAWCLFRRNTLLECGEQRVVVSTVGNYHIPIRGEESGPVEPIGYKRYYETMAFGAAVQGDIYWDADVTRSVCFKARWSVGHTASTADAEANANHEAVVTELTARLERGELVVPPARTDGNCGKEDEAC